VLLSLVTVGVSYVLARKTLAPLQTAYKRQQRFVADAAHELRTPLAVLKAGSELLLQHNRPGIEYKEFMEESLEEIDRLITLSNDLLFLAHNTELKHCVPVPFLISEVCRTQCAHIRPYALKQGITLETQIEEGITLVGNTHDVARLVLNVLKNAVDYNVKGGSVRCTLARAHSSAVLTIEDTGIGIPTKDIPHIFERFYKADTSRTQKASLGSGLGLAIVKEIVDRELGTIVVTSTVGKGTVFTITFPTA
jgi:two-component system, OmpR family, sensor histidine kinase CiaH